MPRKAVPCSLPRFVGSIRHLLFERGIDISHETVLMWWNRFGLMFASDTMR